jgi:spore coat polysaccharide biosynthesis protein SpsF
VLPYLYDPPGRFRVIRLDADRNCGSLRWTVDTPEDLEFVRQVYARLEGRGEFGWREVLALVQAEPELAAINAGVRHKSHRDVG